MRVHNYAAAFLAYWQSVESLPLQEQIEAFHATMAPQFPAFYTYRMQQWTNAGQQPDVELGKQLQAFPALKAQFVEKMQQFAGQLSECIASFQDAHPGFEADKHDVYLVHSFGEMDGGTRVIDGKFYFLFGIDQMARGHTHFDSEVPFFHHELFHVYHNQYLTTEPWQYLWKVVWTEGLAVFVAKQLSPNATPAELLLDSPAGMIDAIEADAQTHWSDLQSKMYSSSEQDYETYFLTSSSSAKIAHRAGYYLGYVLVQHISQTMTTTQMVQLQASDIVPLLQSAIAREIDSVASK